MMITAELKIIRTRIGWIMLVVCGPAVVAAVLVALAVLGMAVK